VVSCMLLSVSILLLEILDLLLDVPWSHPCIESRLAILRSRVVALAEAMEAHTSSTGALGPPGDLLCLLC
jgi:hypothetical protein